MDAVFTYGLVMLLCSVVMIGHLFINSAVALLALTATFGCLYGSMNVLIAVAPSKEFGKEKLVMVFGYILFFGGIGALIGPPLAGTSSPHGSSLQASLAVRIPSLAISRGYG